jgi:hypothetical protein
VRGASGTAEGTAGEGVAAKGGGLAGAAAGAAGFVTIIAEAIRVTGLELNAFASTLARMNASTGGQQIAAAWDGFLDGLAAVNLPIKGLVKPFGDFVANIDAANQSLAHFSPAMAAVVAQADVADFLRKQELGELTAQSAQDFNETVNRVLDQTMELRAVVQNILNEVGVVVIEILRDTIVPIVQTILEILKLLPFIGDKITDIEKHVRDMRDGKGTQHAGLGEWMRDIADDAQHRMDESRQRLLGFAP